MRTTGSYIILAALSMLLVMSACVEEAHPSDEDAPDGIVFTATHEGLTIADTKTYLSSTLVPEWADGDAIGVTSASDVNVKCELLSAADGAFRGYGIRGDAPFRVVYPYDQSNTFEGNVLTAVVPALQEVSEGQRVAPGALVSACVSLTRELSFRNCVSLMQIEVPRSDISRIVIEATGENEYLSGKFTMDLAAETLKPVVAEGDESLSASVTLTAREGALEVGTYYLAVLPTPISGVMITFTNISEESISVFKESPVTLIRSNGVNFGKFFTYDISTPEELLAWSKSSARFTKWDVVSINSDIDMTDAAADYSEAVDFKGVFNGNGNTISGLTTPLFANLYGYVDNLTLESSIIYRGKTRRTPGHLQAVGMLAHIAYAEEHPRVTISNVTTKGSLTIKRTNSYNKYFCAGGLLGSSNGVMLKNCHNHASVTLESITLTESASRLVAGGVVGQVVSSAATMENCVNHAPVTVSEGCTTPAQCIVGGVAGYVSVNSSFLQCVNEGDVTNSAVSASGCFTGGVIGTAGIRSGTNGTSDVIYAGSIEKFGNSGHVTDNSAGAETVSHWVAGGVAFANVSGVAISDCENAGDISLASPTCATVSVGGVFGQMFQSGSSTVRNCNNMGAITIDDTVCETIYEGGIVAFTNNDTASLLKCTNRGGITNYGTASSSIRVGGLVGFAGAGAAIGTGADDVCSNFGALQSYSAQEAHSAIGGIVGQSASKTINIYGASNYGDLSFITTATTSSLYLGGIAGRLGTSPTLAGCINYCSLTANGPVTNVYAASLIACSAAGTTVIKNCKVAGKVLDTELDADNFREYLCAYYSNSKPKATLEDNSYLLDGSGGGLINTVLGVGTYNVLSSSSTSREPHNTWDAAKGTIASIIAKMNCDIMTVNEIGVVEIEYLTSQLPQMSIVEFPNHNGGYSTASGILYNTSRLTLLDEGIFWLSDPDTPEVITEQSAYSYRDWGTFPFNEYKASSGRSCVWGRFQDNRTLRRFCFFAPHPHHRGDDRESSYFNTEKSLNSATIRSLLKQIQYINADQLPYIVAGDMNSDSSYISYGFFADSGLASSFEAARDSGTLDARTSGTPSTCPGADPDSYRSKTKENYRLDHIFHCSFQTQSYTNIFTQYTNTGDGKNYYPSDHLPVKVILDYE